MGALKDLSTDRTFRFFDKDTYPVRPTTLSDRVRIVPGGSAIRDGAYIGPGVICMPPSYVNIGAWIGESSLIDSHALVGSCAQIGARVHLSVGTVKDHVSAILGKLRVTSRVQAALLAQRAGMLTDADGDRR